MEDKQEFYSLPQPDEVTIREREDAMGAYLMMFAAVAAGLPLPIINLIASIVYYSINKSKSRFVHFHSLHSLFAQIPTSILNGCLVFWTFRIFFYHVDEVNDYYIGYIWMVAIANLLYFIFSIVAAVKARKGQFYYFLFFGRLTYQMVFRIKDEPEKKEIVNTPPA